MFRLLTPKTETELADYYQFRWEMLRKPGRHPKGSERDAYDSVADHRMIVDAQGVPIAVGRLYINPENDGQIRYMAVDTQYRGRGLGALILMALESLAREEGALRLVCNAREDAIGFYSGHGFTNQGSLTEESGPIRHQQMLKPLDPLSEVMRRPDWCAELQQLWQEKMPISDSMGIRVNQFTGYRFEVSAKLNPNVNPHDSMFAGSVFSMATLAGWGMVWLLIKERHLNASIVLADGHIRYRRPIVERPRAVVSLDSLSGDLDRLANGRKARVKLEVGLYSGEDCAGVYTATFVLMPETLSHEQEAEAMQTQSLLSFERE